MWHSIYVLMQGRQGVGERMARTEPVWAEDAEAEAEHQAARARAAKEAAASEEARWSSEEAGRSSVRLRGQLEE